MNRRLKLEILLVVLMVSPLRLQAKDSPAAQRSVITVALCDKAGVTSSVRAQAKSEAGRVLASAGVGIEWVESCQAPPIVSFFTVVILPSYPSDWPSSSKVLGRAVVLDGPYPRAYVFMDLVKTFDNANIRSRSTPNTGAILGHAIAHELGHLRGESHTTRGIMRAKWGHDQWVEMLSGRMIFAGPAADR